MNQARRLSMVLILTMLLAACSSASPPAQTTKATAVPQNAETTAAAETTPADRPLSTIVAEGPESEATAETVQSAVAEANEESATAAAETQSTAAAEGAAPVGAPDSYVEPPFLAERVSAGTLPPIEERLPTEPFVVGPGTLIQEDYVTWQNGEYGGDLISSAPNRSGFVRISGGSTILRSPSQETEPAVPNVVSEFSHSDDHTTFHFKIREGLKWSDGQPVTTEDVRFTFEDIYQNEELQRSYPTELYTQGNPQLDPAQLNVIDDLTFELTFSQSYGAFIAPLNSWIPSYEIIFKPAHYMKRFHKDYASAEDLAARLQESNETEWATMFNTRDVSHWDIGEDSALGLPTLNAWVLTDAGEQRRVFERNPYFWHVDSDGKQLPYADRVIINVAVDLAAITNAILAGQLNIVSGEEVALNEMPLYVQNAEQANIRAFTTGSFNWPILLFLNHDYQYDDPNSVWQKLITDPERRFGKALAAAINPDDVNDSIYFGLFGAPVMYEGAYNPDEANRLLDELGMTRSGDYRTAPDGSEFIFRITSNSGQADFAPVAELLKEQLEVVGIRVDIDNVAAQLFDERKEANDIMASILWNDGPAWASGISEDYLPNHKGPWSPETWQWFTTGGEEGREPPDYIKEFYQLHTDRKKFPPQSPEGEQVFQQMMTWLEDNYVMIPTAGAKVSANVVGTTLRNVPNEGAPINLDTYINAEGMWIAQP